MSVDEFSPLPILSSALVKYLRFGRR